MSFTPFAPVFLTLGPLQFRYYGLMYVIAFFLCYFFARWAIKKGYFKIAAADLWDILFWGTLGIVLGGRIGYILFYNFSYFLSNPLKVFAVWQGGMSFHGGLLGVIIIGLIYCKIKKRSFYELADLFVIPLAMGVAFAKLGNFINGELYGRPTNVPWAMYFERSGNDAPRHPSQLYELAKNIVIFFVLIWTFKKDVPKGTRFWTFIFLYGLFRSLIEFVREPDVQIGLFWGWVSMGQILSLPMLLIGGWMVGRLLINQQRLQTN